MNMELYAEKAKVYVPPLKIQGIKTKIVPMIKDNVSLSADTVWIEPFMGSGVVGFNVAPRKALFGDTNPYIIEFYNQVKSGLVTSFTIRRYLEHEGTLLSANGEKHYYAIRERFNQEHSPLDFLFLNRSCFNGMIRFNRDNKFNVPYGHKDKRFSKAYITKIVNQVKHVENLLQNNDWDFVCQSFEKTIALADSNSFVYCDPPYIGRHVDYFDSWDKQQEVMLCNLLLHTKAKFMLSTWDHNDFRTNEFIDTLWSSCYKKTKEHFYHVGAREENRNSVVEAMLTNYVQTGNCNIVRNEYEQVSLAMD